MPGDLQLLCSVYTRAWVKERKTEMGMKSGKANYNTHFLLKTDPANLLTWPREVLRLIFDVGILCIPLPLLNQSLTFSPNCISIAIISFLHFKNWYIIIWLNYVRGEWKSRKREKVRMGMEVRNFYMLIDSHKPQRVWSRDLTSWKVPS